MNLEGTNIIAVNPHSLMRIFQFWLDDQARPGVIPSHVFDVTFKVGDYGNDAPYIEFMIEQKED